MELNRQSMMVLNNGVSMPRLGFGTARMKDPTVASQAVLRAIQAGYRLIDTSKNYENEVPVGEGIRQSGVPRAQLFITTKLEKEDHGYEKAKEGYRGSLERLGLDYVDLYLIHAPEDDRAARLEAWRALADLQRDGKVRSIGVSNYEIEHFEEIEREGLPVPAVNQIEVNPQVYAKQRSVIDYCQRHAIAVEAYSPLGVGKLTQDARLVEIARRYRKTTAQLLLRWCLQHDWIPIPKSDQEDHTRENLDVFDFVIADDDLEKIDQLDR